MRSTSDIIDEAVALPVEERARIVESLLRSLNPGADEIEQAWIDEAVRRADQVRSGAVVPVDGDLVMARAQALVRR